MAARGRRRIVHAALAGLVLWAGWALAREVRHLQWREARGLWLDDRPCLWRYGTPPVDRLDGLLRTLRPELAELAAEGSAPVYFSSGFEGQEALCAYTWAAYLAPEATVRQGPPAAPLPRGALWVVAGPQPDRAGPVPIRAAPHGALYRAPTEVPR